MSEEGFIMQSPIFYHRKEKDHPKILNLQRLYEGLCSYASKREEYVRDEAQKKNAEYYEDLISKNLREVNDLLEFSEKVS